MPESLKESLTEDPVRCPQCKALLDQRLVEKHHQTCIHCSFHFRIGAHDRIRLLFDEDSFVPFAQEVIPDDPLQWNENGRTYQQMLAVAEKRSGMSESIIVGTAKLADRTVATGIFDFNFMGGTLGSVAGERIARLLEYAAEHKLPVFLFTMSGGARMQEGMISLMQMAKIATVLRRFQGRKNSLITILCDPTTGGVAASIGFMGDVILAEPGALVGFSGPRVIVETIGQEAPEGFQNAENRVKQGLIDQVVHRSSLRQTLRSYLELLP